MARTRSNPALRAALLVAGFVGGITLGAWYRDAAAAPEPAQVAAPEVRDTRICAAVAVYETATADDWGMRAVIAQTALNSFEVAGEVADCGAPLAAALAGRFVPRRWQDALNAVDAVRSGSYLVPDACARATAVVPLSQSTADAVPSAAARAQCVISGLAFVGSTR